MSLLEGILGSLASPPGGQQQAGANPLLAVLLQLLSNGLGPAAGGGAGGGLGGGMGGALGSVLGGALGGGMRGGGMRGGGGAGGGAGGLGDVLGGLLGAMGSNAAPAQGGGFSGGGVEALIDHMRNAGFGQHVDSWVGTGANMPISGEQLRQALGAGTVDTMASRAGVAPDALSGGLAQLLPQVIDALTPHGSVPQGGFGDAGQLLQALQGLGGRR